MGRPGGGAGGGGAPGSSPRRSSASASNSSLRARRYSLDSSGKWTFGSRSTSRHLFMSRGLPLRAIVSILSYAPNSLPCGVGNSERLFMYCAFLWGNHSAVEHREEGVEDVGHSCPTIGALPKYPARRHSILRIRGPINHRCILPYAR